MSKGKFGDIISNPLFELFHIQPEEAIAIAEGQEGHDVAIVHAKSCEYCAWLLQDIKDFLDGKQVSEISPEEQARMIETILGHKPLTF